MSVSYNAFSEELMVTITHSVPDPQIHYIKQVQVIVNDKVVNSSPTPSQPSPETFWYTYPLPARPKDIIYATASCVLKRSLSRQIHMSGATAIISTFPATRKDVAGIAPVLSLVILFVSKKA